MMRFISIAILASVLSLIAACGSDDDTSKSGDGSDNGNIYIAGKIARQPPPASGAPVAPGTGLSDLVRKLGLSREDAGLTLACLDLAERMQGQWATWDFTVLTWQVRGSSALLTNEEMGRRGFSVVYRRYPSDITVTLNRSQRRLETSMATTTQRSLKINVNWDVYYKGTNQCAFVQNAYQQQTLFSNQVAIVVNRNVNVNSSFRTEFHSMDPNGDYSNAGEVKLLRHDSDNI